MVLPTFCSLFPLPGLHLFPIQRRIAYFFVYWNPSYPPGLRSAITFLWSLSLCLYSKQSPIAFGSPQNVTHPVEKNHFLSSSYYNKGKDSVCFRTGAWQIWSSLVTQTVKNSPAMQETRVRSLVWEDPLEKGMATHPSILVWRISWIEEPGGLQSMGSQRVGQDELITLSLSHSLISAVWAFLWHICSSLCPRGNWLTYMPHSLWGFL